MAVKYYEDECEHITKKKTLSDEDITNASKDLIKKVNLSATSVYDTGFWMFYWEDNPDTIDGIKAKLGITFITHLTIIYVFLLSKIDTETPIFMADNVMGFVRLIAALLLHF